MLKIMLSGSHMDNISSQNDAIFHGSRNDNFVNFFIFIFFCFVFLINRNGSTEYSQSIYWAKI